VGRSPEGVALPHWYGLHYPTIEDLEAYAWELGAKVVYGNGNISKGAYFPAFEDYGIPAVLVVPNHSSHLAQIWSLAHELGHLVLHMGYTSPWTRAKQETQAERWAACALIPEARIRKYENASLDAFIAALSAHFEDLPLHDCPQRKLAGKIARIRLKSVIQEVA
jgi:Zn-dependent peptidase ImmA (M78 family)